MKGILPALGLTSLTVIAFQVVVMQILSVAQWHHFAWMVISIAMLGFGAAGTALFIGRRFLTRTFDRAFPLLLAATGFSMAATTLITRYLGTFDVFLLFLEPRRLGLLLATYVLYAVPFFLAGLAISLSFYRIVRKIARVYFVNLIGSGLGAVLVIALLHLVPLEYVPGLLATLPLAGALIVLRHKPSLPGVVGVVLAIAAVVPALLLPQTPGASQYKDISAALDLPDAEIAYRSSSPYGQLEIVRAPSLRYAPGLSLQYREEPPVRDVLFNNGTYFGTLLSAEAADHRILDNTTRVLPYLVRSPRRVAVLDAATGEDVVHALSRPSVEEVIAVEPHRSALRVLTGQYPEWSDTPYRHPAVQTIGGSARQFLAHRETGAFDLIVTPPIGSFGGTSGVYALAEQFHLTVEAFTAMYDRLAPGGMIVATVWLEDPARASLRLLTTWREVLSQRGASDPGAHVLAIRGWTSATFLLSAKPFSGEEAQAVRERSTELGFDPLLVPGGLPEAERARFNRPGDPHFFQRIDRAVAGPASGDSWFNLDPARDDRPFFHHFIRLRALPDLRDTFGAETLPYLELGYFLALAAAVQAVLAAIVLILAPLALSGWSRGSRRWTLLYFAGTGAGYMMFEIVLIQRLSLYLGRPVYAAAAVLGTLMISSGLGSLLSGRFRPEGRRLAAIALLSASLIAFSGAVLSPVLARSLGHPLPIRGLLAVLYTAPAGFCMGMLFPLGLRRLADTHDSHIPWACAIDSCLAVSVTAPAVLLALHGGFGRVGSLAAGMYVLVAGAALRLGAVPSTVSPGRRASG